LGSCEHHHKLWYHERRVIPWVTLQLLASEEKNYPVYSIKLNLPKTKNMKAYRRKWKATSVSNLCGGWRRGVQLHVTVNSTLSKPKFIYRPVSLAEVT
jgi:hypothetical protein